MARATFGVYAEADGSGFYAGAARDGRIVWRSLTTRNERKAERWMAQAHCHGAREHHLDCSDCKEAGG